MREPSDPWRDHERARANYPQPTPEDERAARYHEAVTLRRLQSAEKLMSPTTPELKYAPGPHQRSFQAEQYLQNAQASGDPRKIRDAEIYADRARKAVAKADAPPKTPSQLIFEAFMSSRIGPGGKLMPLVSKLMQAGITQEQLQQQFGGQGHGSPDGHGGTTFHFGKNGVNVGADALTNLAEMAPAAANIAKLALPIIAASGAASSVVSGVVLATNRALEMGRAGGAAYWSGGGSAAATGRGMALSNFVGKDLGSAAVGFGDQLRQSSFGAGYFRSRGITDLGPYTTDKTSNYIRGIDELRRIKSDQMAIRVARDTGMTDELRYRDLSNESYNRLRDSMGDRGAPETRKAAAEFDANKAILGNQWDKFTAEIGNAFVPMATSVVHGLNNITDPDYWRLDFGNKDWRRRHGSMLPGDQDSSSPGGIGGGSPMDSTRYRQLKDGAEQIGGGNRANGIPAGWSSSWKLQNTDEALKAQVVMMGGFAVG
jgi:hypothetical protein